MSAIDFDKERRDGLRRAYKEAVALNQFTFTYQGYEYTLSYAAYLLQYLDLMLGQ